jgi:hypothetical protein
METTTEDIVEYVREWSISRASDVNLSEDDSRAILSEFYEWIDPDSDELEIISLSPED